jgi:hypothetical protein
VQPNPHINWVLGLRDVKKKDEKSAPKFAPITNYHKEAKTLKPTKTHYPSNPKSSFNLKSEVKKETPKPREQAFVCMFCSCAGHLDEFCFHHKRIKKRRFKYARNSYRASPRTSSRVLPHVSYGPNHRSYDFGSQENSFVPGRFRYGSRPHRGDCYPRMPGFFAGASHTRFEPRHFDGPHFLVVVHVSLDQMVRCKGL